MSSVCYCVTVCYFHLILAKTEIQQQTDTVVLRGASLQILTVNALELIYLKINNSTF